MLQRQECRARTVGPVNHRDGGAGRDRGVEGIPVGDLAGQDAADLIGGQLQGGNRGLVEGHRDGHTEGRDLDDRAVNHGALGGRAVAARRRVGELRSGQRRVAGADVHLGADGRAVGEDAGRRWPPHGVGGGGGGEGVLQEAGLAGAGADGGVAEQDGRAAVGVFFEFRLIGREREAGAAGVDGGAGVCGAARERERQHGAGNGLTGHGESFE